MSSSAAVPSVVRQVLTCNSGRRLLILDSAGVVTVCDVATSATQYAFNVVPPVNAFGLTPSAFSTVPVDVEVLSQPQHGGDAHHDCIVVNLTALGCGVAIRDGWQYSTVAVLPCHAPDVGNRIIRVDVTLASVLYVSDAQLLVAAERGHSGRVLVFDAKSGVAIGCCFASDRVPKPPSLHYLPSAHAIVTVSGRQGPGTDVAVWDIGAPHWIAATLRHTNDRLMG